MGDGPRLTFTQVVVDDLATQCDFCDVALETSDGPSVCEPVSTTCSYFPFATGQPAQVRRASCATGPGSCRGRARLCSGSPLPMSTPPCVPWSPAVSCASSHGRSRIHLLVAPAEDRRQRWTAARPGRRDRSDRIPQCQGPGGRAGVAGRVVADLGRPGRAGTARRSHRKSGHSDAATPCGCPGRIWAPWARHADHGVVMVRERAVCQVELLALLLAR